jgi:uncharacterized iron-regulated membrane protein
MAGARGGESARLRRWHRRASFVLAPFLLVLAGSGLVYLFAPELERTQLGALLEADPRAGPAADLDAQVALATAALPAHRLLRITLPAELARSTELLLAAPSGERVLAFVDPFAGRLLGTHPADGRVSAWARQVHGTLLLGEAGSLVVEAVAWGTLAQLGTGLWLAARGRRRARGTRSSQAPALRRHVRIGILAAPLVAAFLVTGLPWTTLFGGALARAQTALGQAPPEPAAFGAHQRLSGPLRSGSAPLEMETLAARARAELGPGRLVLTLPPAPGESLRAERVAGSSADEAVVHLDPGAGDVVVRAGWQDFPGLARAIALGVDLHEGTLWGSPGRLANAAVVLLLLATAASGFRLVCRGAAGRQRARRVDAEGRLVP